MTDILHFDYLKRLDHSLTPERLAQHWAANIDSLALVNDGINVVYRFEAVRQFAYLKISHSHQRSLADLEASYDYLAHLHAQGAPVCQPLLTKAGEKAVEFEQGADSFVASVVKHIEGTVLPEELLPEEHWLAWGRALGQMHNAVDSFKPKPNTHYKSWIGIWERLGALLSPYDQLAQHEYTEITNWFEEMNESPGDFGLTHYDFRAGNALLHDGQVSIIDFDEPVWHRYAADVARPFLELHSYSLEERRQAIQWFLTGYRAKRPFDSYLEENLNWFLRMKTIDNYAWGAANWDARQGDRAAWMRELQARFGMQWV